MNRFFTRSLLCLALLLPAATTQATPVVHTLNPALSSFSGRVSATFGVTANTTLGSLSGSGSASGDLFATPTGTIAVDWGSPVWNSQIELAGGGAPIRSPNAGRADGPLSLNLFGFIPLDVSLHVYPEFIDLNLAGAYGSPTSPLDPSAPGAGPWIGADIVDIALSTSFFSLAYVGLGLLPPLELVAGSQVLGPAVARGVSVVSRLERLGETGSRIALSFESLTLAFGAQAPISLLTPHCDVQDPVFGLCLFDVHSVSVQLTGFTLSDLRGTFTADQSGVAIVPEPSTALLLGAGLAGLAWAGRRRSGED